MSKDNQYKCSLWTKTSEKGTKYASGKIKIEDKEYKIVLFKVGEKKTEKSPDFNIILEEIKIKEEKNKKETDEQIYAEFGDLTEIDDSQIAF